MNTNLSPMRILNISKLLVKHRNEHGPGGNAGHQGDADMAKEILDEAYPEEELWEAIDRLMCLHRGSIIYCHGCNWNDVEYARKAHYENCRIAGFYAHIGRQLPAYIRPITPLLR